MDEFQKRAQEERHRICAWSVHDGEKHLEGLLREFHGKGFNEARELIGYMANCLIDAGQMAVRNKRDIESQRMCKGTLEKLLKETEIDLATAVPVFVIQRMNRLLNAALVQAACTALSAIEKSRRGDFETEYMREGIWILFKALDIDLYETPASKHLPPKRKQHS